MAKAHIFFTHEELDLGRGIEYELSATVDLSDGDVEGEPPYFFLPDGTEYEPTKEEWELLDAKIDELADKDESAKSEQAKEERQQLIRDVGLNWN